MLVAPFNIPPPVYLTARPASPPRTATAHPGSPARRGVQAGPGSSSWSHVQPLRAGRRAAPVLRQGRLAVGDDVQHPEQLLHAAAGARSRSPRPVPGDRPALARYMATHAHRARARRWRRVSPRPAVVGRRGDRRAGRAGARGPAARGKASRARPGRSRRRPGRFPRPVITPGRDPARRDRVDGHPDLSARLYSGSESPGGGAVPSIRRRSPRAGPLAGGRVQRRLPAEGRGRRLLPEGRRSTRLRPGAASLVIGADGRVTVGAWGRDVRMTPGVVSVRQNLVPLVAAAGPRPRRPAVTGRPGDRPAARLPACTRSPASSTSGGRGRA